MVRFIEDDGDEQSLAPVIPLFGGAADQAAGAGGREPSARGGGASHAGGRAGRGAGSERVQGSPSAEPAAAERVLLKRLAGRSLSVREARAVLARCELADEPAAEIVERFVDLGYLDDARLAEQLVHSGIERKGQGRQAIALTLARRGVPRDLADAALEALPADDSERALEYARTAARSMGSLDHDTALRRLLGRLGRRGFGGAVATNAARQALSELDAPASGVRFR